MALYLTAPGNAMEVEERGKWSADQRGGAKGRALRTPICLLLLPFFAMMSRIAEWCFPLRRIDDVKQRSQ